MIRCVSQTNKKQLHSFSSARSKKNPFLKKSFSSADATLREVHFVPAAIALLMGLWIRPWCKHLTKSNWWPIPHRAALEIMIATFDSSKAVTERACKESKLGSWEVKLSSKQHYCLLCNLYLACD